MCLKIICQSLSSPYILIIRCFVLQCAAIHGIHSFSQSRSRITCSGRCALDRQRSSAVSHGREDSGPLSQRTAGRMQNRKTKTNTNPSPDPNRYSRRCPDPNGRIQKFIHYMAIATFAIADLCDSGLSPAERPESASIAGSMCAGSARGRRHCLLLSGLQPVRVSTARRKAV